MKKLFLIAVFVLGFALQGWGADYYVGGSGTDDGSHGTGTGTDAWASLEYALEDGGLSEDDTLYLEHSSGIFSGDYWKSGTNNSIAASISNTSGRFKITSIDATQVVLIYPADTGSYFFTLMGDCLVENVKVVNSTSKTSGYVFVFYSTCDLQLKDFEVDGDAQTGFSMVSFWDAANTQAVSLENVTVYGCKYTIFNGNSTSTPTVTVAGDTIAYDLNKNFIYSTGGLNIIINNLICYNVYTAVFDLSSTGYSYDISDSIFVKRYPTESELYIFKFADATALEIYDDSVSTTDIKDNIFWITGTLNATAYDEILYSPSYQYIPIPKTNRFIEPDGDDTAGWTWPIDPITAPVLSSSLGAFFGDSILYGASATTGNACFDEWEDLTSLTSVSKYSAAIGGLEVNGGRFFIDRLMTQVSPAPKYVYVSIGINNMWQTNTANIDVAEGAELIMQKIIDYGATPIWLGVTSLTGNPPDNTDVDAVNVLVQTWCDTNDVAWGDILTEMEETGTWKTDYYADLTADVHPNNAGHELIGHHAAELLGPAQRKTYLEQGATGIGIASNPADDSILEAIFNNTEIFITGDFGAMDLSGATGYTNPTYQIKAWGLKEGSLTGVTHYGTNGEVYFKNRGGRMLHIGGGIGIR